MPFAPLNQCFPSTEESDAVTSFDIVQLDAAFHLQALGRRWLLQEPLGIPDWGLRQKRLISTFLFQRRNSLRSEQCARALEGRLCQLLGAQFCIATGSGREAIKLALLGFGLQPGDRVVMPSFCCLSVLVPVLELGLTPVFADAGDDWQIDPESVQRVMRPGDRVLIVPHLFGRLADIERLTQVARSCGARIVDDAAQAIGSKGSWGWAGRGGDAGIFSFGLGKPLPSIGGGALITDDRGLFEEIRSFMSEVTFESNSRKTVMKTYIKAEWRQATYVLYLNLRRRQQKNVGAEEFSVLPSSNVRRIADLDALLAESQLGQIEGRRKALQEKAGEFADALDHLPFLKKSAFGYVGSPRWVVELIPMYAGGDFYRGLFAYMLGRGIEVQPTYRPLHQFVRESGHEPQGEFAHSETLAKRLLCLPFSAQTDIHYVARCLRDYASAVSIEVTPHIAEMAEK